MDSWITTVNLPPPLIRLFKLIINEINKEKNVKNIYQITPKGTEKFKKIRDDCLDHITQRILHVHKKDDDE